MSLKGRGKLGVQYICVGKEHVKMELNSRIVPGFNVFINKTSSPTEVVSMG